MVLPIPAYSPKDFGQTLFKLLQLIEMVDESGSMDITIDLSQTKFLNCIYLSGLYNFIEMWRNNGKTVNVYSQGSIQSYLEQIHFEDQYNVEQNEQLLNEISKFNNKRFIPIVKFPTSEIARENCISAVCNLIRNQTNISANLYQALNYFVSELTNNIADHSQCIHGVISAQSYPKLGYIDITFADHGIGLLKCYQNDGRYSPESDSAALDLAMNGNSTKDQAVTRGFGLPTSKKMLVKGLKGTFIFWSGHGLLIETSDNSSILEVQASYQGCFLALRLPLLPKDEFEFYKYVE